ncbi:cysteine synthase A [Curtanaerobium respiraculi]|jgi:cysteine synthase A|uniref:cysteine synthase A n=1 Tax=Curtanaerobium respiraculi TaxID=2949669 RepID=UPI0024B3BCBF|nr:cysteine synthase A [Curtanaerobium respiraculi]
MGNIERARSIDQLIGKTPLIDISGIGDGSATIWGKYEAANPGGSVKDRIAKAIIDDGEARGLIDKDTVLIESTSGNTGVGLAMVAASRGYKLIITMPETMSVERRDLIRSYGAELILTPGSEGVPGADKKAKELLATTPNSFAPSQFTNPVNPRVHYETTGPEIWDATEGAVDAFVAGVGTGGTISGAGKYLRERNPAVKIFAVEPEESQVLAGKPSGKHKIQGLAPGFVPETMDMGIYDELVHIDSATAFEYQRKMSHELGLLVGISSGAAAAAAARIAQRPEFAGKTIIALLPDTGERYLSMLPD